MSALAPGDVVVVPFPYSDQLAEKRRPAVVVSSPELENRHGILWVAMITSTQIRWNGDVPITDLRTAGLPVRCVIRSAKLATISRARIVRKSGELSRPDWERARAQLARYFPQPTNSP